MTDTEARVRALADVLSKAAVRDGAQGQLNDAVAKALSVARDREMIDRLSDLTGVSVVALKSEADSPMAAINVVKSSDERRYTLGLAYPALKADVAVAADGHIDFAGPEALEKTAWEWMAKHRDVNLYHRGGTSGHATVVESYVYRGPDWHVTSPASGKETVIKAGDWLLGTVWDEHGWRLVKEGLLNGWSPEGGARRAKPSPERLALLRS